MKPQFLFFTLALLFTFCNQTLLAQVSFSSTVPLATDPLDVCGDAKIFTVSLQNVGVSNTNGTLEIGLPTGIRLEGTTVSYTIVPSGGIGTLTNTSTDETPIFTLPIIAPTETLNLTYNLKADCRRINEPVNVNTFTYTPVLGSVQTASTAGYNVRYAALTILNVSNNNYTGVGGGTFTRTITVINGGFGRVQNISIDETNTNGLILQSVTGGTISVGAGTSNGTIFINNFTSIGNNDAYFDENEQISFTETMLIPNPVGCYTGTSASITNYTAYYGCYGNNPCPVTNSTDIKGYATANTTWNTTIAVATLTGVAADITFPTCIQTPVTYTLKGYNWGAATASAISVQLGSRSEFQYLDDFAVNGVPITPIVINPANPAYFSPAPSANAGYTVQLNLPNLAAGDSFSLTLKGYRINNNTCINYDAAYIYGFDIESGSFWNGCQTVSVDVLYGLGIPQRAGNYWEDAAYYTTESAITNPVIIHDGEKGNFCTSMDFKLPMGYDNTGYYEFSYILPQGIAYNPATCAISFVEPATSASWPLTSATMYGDTLKVRFSNATMPAIFSGSKSLKTICIELEGVNTINCGTWTSTLIGRSKFITSSSCNKYYNFCRVLDSYIEHPCTPSPCEGITSIDFSNKRTSYGTVDANNDNVTDATGSVNPALIADRHVILGDTMKMNYRGIVYNPNNITDWNYGYVAFFFNNNPVGNGKADPVGGATVKIWDASASTYFTLSNIPATVTYPGGSDITFVYDFSSSLPSGFAFAQGDSILLEGKYRLIAMQYHATIKVRPYAYVSSTPDANADQYTQPPNQKGCGQTPDYYTTHPFHIQSQTENANAPNGCNVNGFIDTYMETYFDASVNWSGGIDAFPYEVRHAVYPTTWTYTLPLGATYVPNSAVFNHWSSAGGDIDITNLTPISTSGGQVVFDLKPIYQRFGGTIPDRAEAFTYELRLEFTGNCGANINQTLPFVTDYEYVGPLASLVPNGTSGDDYTVNLAANAGISIGTSQASITSAQDTVAWTITVGNGPNEVSNVWLAQKPGISGVTITKVTQLTQWFGYTHPPAPFTIAPDANGIYHLEDAPSYWGNSYEIQAVFSSCVKDSISLITGYDCTAYPTSVSNPNLLCNYSELKLYVSPEITQLQQIITAVPTSAINLCDTVAYKIAVASVQLGTVDNVKTYFVMSPGTLLAMIPNSSQVEYPNGSGTWVNIPNPSLVGSTYMWDISQAPALAATLGATGLTGITTVPNNRFNLRFQAVTTPCNIKDGITYLFTTLGTKSCGADIWATDQITSPLNIIGAPTATNDYDVHITTTDAEPCNGNPASFRFAAKNLGGSLSSASEYIELIVYSGGSSTGTPTNIHNGPSGIVSTSNTAGGVVFRYQMPAGIAVGDSIVFSIPVSVSANLACDTTRVRLEGNINIAFNTVCSTNPLISCDLGKILGQDTRFIEVARPQIGVAVNGFSVSSVLNPPSGELLTANLVVQNTGTLNITPAHPFSVSFYHDADMNGVLSVGDELLGNQVVTTTLAPAATYTLVFTQSITGGKVCPILASLDYTPCYCSDTTVVTSIVPVSPASYNLTLCPGIASSPLGTAAITGYTYNWTSAQAGALAYLSATNIANPTFTKNTNTSGGVETFVYTLYINRGAGCIATQTITIHVDNPVNCPQFYGSIGNYVWEDTDLNALQNESALKGLNGITVQLYVAGPDGLSGTADDTLKQTVITANDGFGNKGFYLFDSLYTSNYYVKFPTSSNSYVLTTQTATSATNGNSDANVSTGYSPVFAINAMGTGVQKDNMTIDAGYKCNLTASIAKSNDLSCPTPSAILTASPSSGVSYLWNTSETTASITVTSPGQYTVTLTDVANGCTVNANVTVTSTISIPPCVPITIQKTK